MPFLLRRMRLWVCSLLQAAQAESIRRKKSSLPDGLELVIPRIHRIGLHRKLRACGEEDDLYVGVVLPNLPGRRHPVLARHQNIQQHDVEACHPSRRLPSAPPSFGRMYGQIPALGQRHILSAALPAALISCGFVVTECDFQHKGIYTVPSLVYFVFLLLLIV